MGPYYKHQMKGGDAFWQLEIVTLKWSLPRRTETINFFKVKAGEMFSPAFLFALFSYIMLLVLAGPV